MYMDRYKFRETEGERPCKREMEGEGETEKEREYYIYVNLAVNLEKLMCSV